MHSLFSFVSSRFALALSASVALSLVACAAPNDAPSEEDVSTPDLAAPSAAPKTSGDYDVKSEPELPRCQNVGKTCSVTNSTTKKCTNGKVVCSGIYEYCRLPSGVESATYELTSCPKVIGAVVR